jgi:hypothetical protein
LAVVIEALLVLMELLLVLNGGWSMEKEMKRKFCSGL